VDLGPLFEIEEYHLSEEDIHSFVNKFGTE